jgi:hypothetical protein
MSPACGCQQSVRLERLLSEAAADSWPHSGLAEFLSIADVTRRSCDLHQRGDDPLGVGVMRATPHPCRRGPATRQGDNPDGVPSTGSPHAARRFTDRHSRRRREQCGHGRAASVKCHVGCTDLTSGMRDLDTVDSEPRLLAAVRRSIREHGGEPSSRQVDELLDERLLLARR